jgi:DNA polymerase kappa
MADQPPDLKDLSTPVLEEVPSQNTSLKYRLLGPSLTKAGQDSVDQNKVSEIIYNASKGSKFFANEQARDRALTDKITRILARRDQLLKQDLSHELRRADDYIASLEAERDLSQVIVHVDCDAFYAAVEELDRPELKKVPMAVGRGVVTTCNYVARKYGVRSGMASFVAMKLCPELICLPINFAKYGAKSDEVRAVFARYDPRFQSASMDEAYLNITAFCKEHGMDPWDVVQQMRAEIHDQCKITVSAGIAANGKIAKIGSNRNKPNGQFRIPSNRESIMEFMRDLPTRKVNGIGRVFERELDAIGIKTCGDVYHHRSLLNKLFGEKAFQFIIQTYLGLGRTVIKPAEEFERKSVGTERTFGELEGKAPLRAKLRDITVELEDDLKRNEVKGRTLVLKVKLHTYEVLTRQTITPFAVCTADDLERYALPMLSKLEKDFARLRLRLMGLRCTGLVSTQKTDIDFFGMKKGEDREQQVKVNTDADGWEVWPEEEFEDAAKRERDEELQEMEQLSQEYEAEKDRLENAKEEPKEQFWDCPICRRPQPADNTLLNQHVDLCLSRQAIKDVVHEATVNSSGDTPKLKMEPVQVKKKRGRPSSKKDIDTERSVKRKAFFS